MLVIAYRALKSPFFGHALGNLGSQAGLPASLKLQVMRVLKRLEEARAEADQLYDAILLEFAEKDEKGCPLQVPGQQGALKVPQEKTEALAKRLDDYYALSVELDMAPLPFDPLAEPLSPRDLLLLAPLFGTLE